MSTDGEVPGRQDSDEVFDFNCAVCLRRNIFKRADKFCQECPKYLCSDCVVQHNEFMDNHTLLDPGAGSQTTVEGIRTRNFSIPTERCQRHPNEILQMFCTDHSEVLCNVCVSLSHRACLDIKYIPSDASALLRNENLEVTQNQLRESLTDVGQLKSNIQDLKSQLVNEKESYLSRIREYQDKLIRLVQALGQADEDKVNNKFVEVERELTEYTDQINDIETDIEDCLRSLDAEHGNNSQKFITIRKGRNLINTTKEKVERNKDSTWNLGWSFSANTDIERNLTQIQSLGSYDNYNYKAIHTETIYPLDNDGNTIQDVTSASFLPDGSVLLTDFADRRIKQLDMDYLENVKYSNQLNRKAWSACYINTNEVAVCTDDMSIQFLSTDRLRVTREFTVNHFCRGICYSDEELFVTSGDNRTVYVYNLRGEQQRRIKRNSSGANMFTCPRDIAVSPDGRKLYIADRDHGLICTDRQGKELFRYRGTSLRGGTGVCLDNRGGVFVTGSDSNNVVYLDKDGEEKGQVLTTENPLFHPQSVCFNSMTKCLIVTMSNQSFLLVSYLLYN